MSISEKLHINFRNSPSKSKHVVILDLDQTLLSTQEGKTCDYEFIYQNASDELKDRIYNLSYQRDSKEINFWGVYRPHVFEFLLFAFNYFQTVIVWSAGEYGYVHAIVDDLFGKVGYFPHFILTRNEIVETRKTNVGKPIKNIGEINQVLARYAPSEEIFCIDDNPSTAIFNKDNIIQIPPYEPFCNIDNFSRDDIALLQIEKYLLRDDVIRSLDVKNLNKKSIFNQTV